MEKFVSHTGTAMPLRRSDVDTDQIIPASYLKRISRFGFEEGLFAAWRSDPEFVLNQPQYSAASILITGPDFGTGSSREHAVWALQQYGFRVVIGSRFGPIFANNAGNNGLLLATVDHSWVENLWDRVTENPATELTVDLEGKTITAGPDVLDFEIDANTRSRLLQGLDSIALTLQESDHIAAFERTRPAWFPRTPASVTSN
jgi:3-isopropylmalate/(R)-2-methylmalate dehydratase small subunit